MNICHCIHGIDRILVIGKPIPFVFPRLIIHIDIVIKVDPAPVPHILIRRSIRICEAAGCIHNVVIAGHMHICTSLLQSFNRWNCMLCRINSCIITGICKPDAHSAFGKILDLLIRNELVRKCFTNRICLIEVIRMFQNQFHGHIAAIGASTNNNSVRINIRIALDVALNQIEQGLFIHGTLVTTLIIAIAAIHPHGLCLWCNHIRTIHLLLEFIRDQRCDFIAKQIHIDIIVVLGYTFTSTMEPDHKRILMIIRIWFPLAIRNCDVIFRILLGYIKLHGRFGFPLRVVPEIDCCMG